MRYVCVLISMCLFSCGRPPAKIDPILKPYLMQFETDVNASTEGIDVGFGTLQFPVLGECESGLNSQNNKITIDSAYWAKASNNQKQQLVYHELGHCALGLGHVTTFKADRCPDSIMYPYAFGDSYCYSNERNYYFQELESHK